MSDVNSELKNIIEAALLAAGEPLTLDRMLSLFPAESRPSKREIGDALKMLEKDYEGRGIELKRAERSYRFQTREKYGEWISRLHQERPPRYSRALLETLAIIAYRQPVTRGDIEEIRGVSVSAELFRTLLVREWIHQVGHRDVPGRPGLYGTTCKFAEHFNLTSLDELPPLAEMRNLEEIGKELGFQLGTQSELPIAGGVADQADLLSPEVDAVQADDQRAPRGIESPEPAHDHTRVGES
ncbi:MAG: SMC-Scp complex subunit ScpB [Gammaproteobacteria bacterium]|nr:SMC-Scp complex subunit ScpB [Gammaproteobacteria bacterium]